MKIPPLLFRINNHLRNAFSSREYKQARTEYLNLYPVCQIPGCTRTDVGVHHRKGRKGDLLTDLRYFMSVCTDHHIRIHQRVQESIEKGYIILREGFKG